MNGKANGPKAPYRPGPPKGRTPLVPGTELTRSQLAIEVGMDLVERAIKPTIEAVNSREPLLTLGWLNANSKVLEPCRAKWRGEKAAETAQVEDENVVSLDRARADRAIAELREEKAKHEQTREELREANVLISRLLKGFAEEMPLEEEPEEKPKGEVSV